MDSNLFKKYFYDSFQGTLGESKIIYKKKEKRAEENIDLLWARDQRRYDVIFKNRL